MSLSCFLGARPHGKVVEFWRLESFSYRWVLTPINALLHVCSQYRNLLRALDGPPCCLLRCKAADIRLRSATLRRCR